MGTAPSTASCFAAKCAGSGAIPCLLCAARPNAAAATCFLRPVTALRSFARLNLDLEGTRSETGEETDNAMMVRGTIRW